MINYAILSFVCMGACVMFLWIAMKEQEKYNKEKEK